MERENENLKIEVGHRVSLKAFQEKEEQIAELERQMISLQKLELLPEDDLRQRIAELERKLKLVRGEL